MTLFTVKILTLFPEMFPGPLGLSLAGKALEKGIWRLETINPRSFAMDVHKTVDDAPLGGGAGMVMKPDILAKTLEAARPLGRLIYMSPRGTPLTQKWVEDIAATPEVTILCGRYEGVDQRLLDFYAPEEISVGDYVLSGGEAAALTLLDACVRRLPGVLGNADTHGEESFTDGLLEYPHYTRPAVWVDPSGVERVAPDVLISGHHAKVKAWRRAESEKITALRRPDLWAAYQNAQNMKK